MLKGTGAVNRGAAEKEGVGSIVLDKEPWRQQLQCQLGMLSTANKRKPSY